MKSITKRLISKQLWKIEENINNPRKLGEILLIIYRMLHMNPSEEKFCPKCEDVKSLKEFSKGQGYCKECCAQIQREYRKTAAGKEVMYKRNHSPKGKASFKKYAKSEKGRETRRRYQKSAKGKAAAKASLDKYPLRRKARDAVCKAVKRGKLTRPDICSQCGRDDLPIESHHHKGYSRKNWLDIVWLCRSCHHKIHWGKEN